MALFLALLLVTPLFCFGALSLDRCKIETNLTVGTVDLKYVNDEKGMAIMNISAQTFHTITKATMYLTANIVLKKEGRALSKEFMRTRIDVAKLLKGLHGNLLMKSFMANVFEYIQALNLTFPIAAKTYNLYNVAIRDTAWVPLPNNTQGNVELKFVGSIRGSNATRFIGSVNAHGTFRRT